MTTGRMASGIGRTLRLELMLSDLNDSDRLDVEGTRDGAASNRRGQGRRRLHAGTIGSVMTQDDEFSDEYPLTNE